MSLAEQPPTAQRSVEPRLGVEPAPHKIGLIALSSDMVTERDFSLMLPACGEVMYYTSRVLLTLPVTVENLRRMGPDLSEAASLILPTGKLNVIAYSCTSASVVIGDDAVTAAIQQAKPGVPCITPPAAA
jgi:maleate isomerase